MSQYIPCGANLSFHLCPSIRLSNEHSVTPYIFRLHPPRNIAGTRSKFLPDWPRSRSVHMTWPTGRGRCRACGSSAPTTWHPQPCRIPKHVHEGVPGMLLQEGSDIANPMEYAHSPQGGTYLGII